MSSRAEAPTSRRPPASIRVVEARDGQPRLVERPTPPLASGEALVAVIGASCGTAELGELAAAARGACPGGALYGEVVAVAPDVHHLSPGTLAVAPSRLACGSCTACRRGRAEACSAPHRARPGGLSSHVCLPARALVPLEGGLERAADAGWSLAVAGSALLLAYHGLARAGLMPGELAVVAGVDAAGLATVQVAVAQGAVVLAVDVDEARLDAARRSGARGTISCADLAPVEAAAAVERWCVAEGLGTARQTVVASAGGHAHLARAAGLVQPGGALVVLGRPRLGAALELAPLAAAGATVIALEDGHPDLLVECLALCARGAVSPPALTRAFAAGDVAAAVLALRRGDDTRLAIIRFGDD